MALTARRMRWGESGQTVEQLAEMDTEADDGEAVI